MPTLEQSARAVAFPFVNRSQTQMITNARRRAIPFLLGRYSQQQQQQHVKPERCLDEVEV